MSTRQPATSRHRVLATQSRVDLLDALHSAGRPLSVAEAAGAVGLHPNTARVHLEQLVGVGLVERLREDRDQPGRPRTLYAAVPDTESGVDDAVGREDYRTLAALLARELGAAPGARRAAIEAGRRWAMAEGGYGSHPTGPADPADPDGTVDELVRIMDSLGFRPTREPGAAEVLLHRCPFEEVARETRSVVCGVHLGLIEGTLDHLGAGVEAVRLESFREERPLLCAVHLDLAGRGGQDQGEGEA